jgi:hypothetical protein
VEVLDPEFEAALSPIFDDLIASGDLLLDARERPPPLLSRSEPGYLCATVHTPDGSTVDVAIQAGLPRPAQVADLAAQMQEIAIEARWGSEMSATWPECPAHPSTSIDSFGHWNNPSSGLISTAWSNP